MITRFKEAVLARMKELGVKQKDLAEMLGLTRQVVKYKIDHDSFTRQELIELQDILHMTSSEILSINGDGRQGRPLGEKQGDKYENK